MANLGIITINIIINFHTHVMPVNNSSSPSLFVLTLHGVLVVSVLTLQTHTNILNVSKNSCELKQVISTNAKNNIKLL